MQVFRGGPGKQRTALQEFKLREAQEGAEAQRWRGAVPPPPQGLGSSCPALFVAWTVPPVL